MLVFVYGVGAFISPQILGGRSGIMLGVVIQIAIDQMADLGFAAAAACLLMLIVLASWPCIAPVCPGASSGWRSGSRSPGGPGTPTPPGEGPPRRPRILPRLADTVGRGLDSTGLSRHQSLLWAFTAAVLVFLVVPQLIAVPISFSSTRTLIFPPRGLSTQWYANFLSSEWLSPAITSLGVAGVVASPPRSWERWPAWVSCAV